MPDSQTHRNFTASALKIVPLTAAAGTHDGLVSSYCTLPDIFHADPEKYLKYAYFKDNIIFHYLPDTSINELYRYWNIDRNGKFVYGKPFVNENFQHAKAGFTYYLGKIIHCWNLAQYEEGEKYLGWLLHVLQDSVFGLHALEGPGGADAFVLNRLIDSIPLAVEPLCRMPQPEFSPEKPYIPRILGNTIDETVMNLYAEYCKSAKKSRQCCFKLIMNEQNHCHDSDLTLCNQMFANGVKLSSDLIATVNHLFSEEKLERENYSLTELEPHVFPFGGYGNYRFRSFERNVIYDKDQTVTDLYLECKNIHFKQGISFGSHYCGSLKYWLPTDIFACFRGTIGIYPQAKPGFPIEIEIINNGEIIDKINLDCHNSCCQLKVECPKGEFGFQMHSTPASGVILLGDPQLLLR